MMQTMRKNMKLVLWILVFAFIATIVFSWGMGGFQESGPKQGIAATINGKEISVDQLEEAFQQRYQYEQNQKGADLSDDQVRQMRSQIWEEILRDLLVAQEVKRLGIRATNKEIAHLIRNAPPDFIRQNEYFQTDGQFDAEKYEQYLRNPAAARDLVMMEQSYRKSLPSQKFINQILSQATVSDQEAWESYVADNLRGKAKYAFLAANTFTVDSSSLSSREIEDYYDAHREDYRLPEKRRILYVLFREQPSREDSANLLHQTEELLQRVRAGEDFATLAKEHSEDRSAENGGDLGFFGRGEMVPEFEAAAFTTPVGELVGPVLSQFGYHLIKVTDRKTEDGVEKVKASHILIKIKPSADTRERLRSDADAFTEEAQKAGFAAAARAYEANIDTTDFFEKGGFIPGLGRLPAASDYIFARPVGESSPVYYVRDGLLAFNVYQLQRERIQPWTEVKSQLVPKILDEKKLDKALERGQSLRQSMTDPTLFTAQIEAAGLSVKETDREFRREDYLRDLGRDLAFTTAALNLNVGAVSQPVKGLRGCYLIQLTEKNTPDSSDFLQQRDEIRTRLLNTKQNEVYGEWLETAKKNAKIVDYRYLYYRDY